MLNNYFQYQFNFSVLECCCSLTKKMKTNLLVSLWCVMKDSGPVFIKQLKLRVSSGVLIYHINKKRIIFLFAINLSLSCFMNTGPGYFWSSNDIFFLEEEGKVEGLPKNHISKIKTNPVTCTLIKKTNKNELMINKTCIFRPVGHDTSRVRVRIHKAT